MGRLRIVAMVLAAALVASGLSPAGAGARVAGRALDDDAVITILARSGIQVFEHETDARPIKRVAGSPSPVRFLRWQTENMAAEAAARNGVIGAELDGLAPLPADAPPLSFLLASYVKSGRTPGAKAARSIMGRQDWKQAPGIAFPSLVQALFVADVVRDVTPDAAPAPPVSGAIASQGAPVGGQAAGPSAASVCSTLSSFTSGALDAVFDALTVDNPGGNVLQLIWNGAVKLVKAALGTAVGAVFAPFIAPLKIAVGILAAVDTLASVLSNWTLQVTATPSNSRFAVGNEDDITGKFVVKVDAGVGADWQQGLEACAGLVQLTLPEPRAKGSPIAWPTLEIDPPLAGHLAVEKSSDLTIQGSSAKASFTYVTGRETEDEADGQELTDYFYVHPKVTRTDVEKLVNLIPMMVLGQVPDIVAPFVNPALQQAIAPLTAELAGVVESPDTFGKVAIKHHKIEACDYPDAVVEPCLVGKWESIQLQFPIQGATVSGGTGAVMTITPEGGVTIDYDPSLEFVVSIPAAGVTGTGKLSGSASGHFTTAAADNPATSYPQGQLLDAGGANLSGALVMVLGQTFPLSEFGQGQFSGSYLIERNEEHPGLDRLTMDTFGLGSVWWRIGV